MLGVVFGGEGAGDVDGVEGVSGGAGAEEAEVVAAEHEAGFGAGVGLEGEGVAAGGFSDEGGDVLLVLTEGEDAAGFAAGGDAVDIDIELEGGQGQEGIA